jgi:hypothetical protein
MVLIVCAPACKSVWYRAMTVSALRVESVTSNEHTRDAPKMVVPLVEKIESFLPVVYSMHSPVHSSTL